MTNDDQQPLSGDPQQPHPQCAGQLDRDGLPVGEPPAVTAATDLDSYLEEDDRW